MIIYLFVDCASDGDKLAPRKYAAKNVPPIDRICTIQMQAYLTKRSPERSTHSGLSCGLQVQARLS